MSVSVCADAAISHIKHVNTQHVYSDSGVIFSLLVVETKNICCPNSIEYYWDRERAGSRLQKPVVSLFHLLFSVQMEKMGVDTLTNQYMYLPANCRQRTTLILMDHSGLTA